MECSGLGCRWELRLSPEMHFDGPLIRARLATDLGQTLRQAVSFQLTPESRQCPKQRVKPDFKPLTPCGMSANWISQAGGIWGPQVTVVAEMTLPPVGWAVPAHWTKAFLPCDEPNFLVAWTRPVPPGICVQVEPCLSRAQHRVQTPLQPNSHLHFLCIGLI